MTNSLFLILNYIQINLDKIVIFLAGAIAGPAAAFMTPLGNQLIARRFARKPAFAISPARLDADLKAKITPLNSLAKQKKPLHAKIGQVYIQSFAQFSKDSCGLHWIADFSNPSVRSTVMRSERCEIQLFFDADLMSYNIEIGRPINDSHANDTDIIHVDSISDLINRIENNAKIYTLFSDGIIDRNFPRKSKYSNWISVHDGKELIIDGVSDLEINGLRARILSSAQYAWVLNFENCNNIIISNIVVGHTNSGYCTGGVIRFKNCNNVQIDRCDLFGCGTYGVEFLDCNDVEVSRTIIRECTYGIANLHNSKKVVFSECLFKENKEFTLFNFKGNNDGFMIRDSKFLENYSSSYLFYFDSILDSFQSIYFNRCVLENNHFLEISNHFEYPTQNDNTINNSRYISSSMKSNLYLNRTQA